MVPSRSYIILVCTSLLLSVFGAGDLEYCPIWETVPRPEGTNDSYCNMNMSKVFSRDDAYTTVTLHQTEEVWQLDSRRDQVISEIEEAIDKGLDLFAAHAGTPAAPLEIHATISAVDIGSFGQLSSEPFRDTLYDVLIYEVFPKASPCYLIIAFPIENSTFPLTRPKKEIVKNMYRCVEQYYHPDIYTFQRIELTWWRESIARFFDGLAWPTAPGMLHKKHEYIGYPEQYSGRMKLTWNGEEAALFWHHAHNIGWSLQRISEWMMAHPIPKNSTDLPGSEDERKQLAADAEFCALFRSFSRALVAGNISYPSAPVDLTATKWRKMIVPYPIVLTLSEQVTIDSAYNEIEQLVPLELGDWEIMGFEALFGPGQYLYFTIAFQDFWVVANIEWSYRRAGTVEWTSAKGGEALRMFVPGKFGDDLVKYEILVTITESYNDPLGALGSLLLKVRRGFPDV
jgi:hypothetical protein